MRKQGKGRAVGQEPTVTRLLQCMAKGTATTVLSVSSSFLLKNFCRMGNGENFSCLPPSFSVGKIYRTAQHEMNISSVRRLWSQMECGREGMVGKGGIERNLPGVSITIYSELFSCGDNGCRMKALPGVGTGRGVAHCPSSHNCNMNN